MSWLFLALLALAVVALIGAEWPRLAPRFGADARRSRERAKRKATWRVLRSEPQSESDKFAEAVQRDLAELPTIEEKDLPKR